MFCIPISGLLILISGILILWPLISIFGIFISNFPFFVVLTPTLTSGIFNVCLFKSIGSSIFPLNIFLIFNGSILISDIFSSIFPLISNPGILILFPFISKLVSILGIFISPSIFGISIFCLFISGILILSLFISIFGTSISIFGLFISIFGRLLTFISGILIFPSIFCLFISNPGICISPSISTGFISVSNFFVFIFKVGISPSILFKFISTFVIGALISTFNSPSIFGISPSIFEIGTFISPFCILILCPLISIFGIFISNFPFFVVLTPTLTSGIFNVCLFKSIGSSIFPLNIFLIFNGSILISGVSIFLIPISIFPKSISGILIFGPVTFKLVSILGTWISPSIFGISILGTFILCSLSFCTFLSIE